MATPERTSATSSSANNGVGVLPESSGLILFDAELLAELMALNQLLDQHNFAEYWQRCAELIRSRTSATGVSIRLLHTHASMPELTIRVGELDSGQMARVKRWEDGLHRNPSGEFKSTLSSDLELGVGRRNEDLPILHMRLSTDGLLQGGLSIIYEADRLPHSDQYEDLADFIHLVTDNGLRLKQLTITRQRLEQVSLVSQVSQSINSSLDLDTVLQETTEMTAYVLNAQAATLFIVDKRQNELVFSVPTGAAGGLLREMRMSMNQGVVGWVAMNGQSIIVNDTGADPRFNAQVDAETGFQTHNILCVPLVTQDRVVGVLEVLNKEDADGFTDEDREWLETMGNQAAIALENARLYQDLRKEQERIIKAQEEVRHQLARDLHDGAAQMLSLIIMNIDVTRRLLGRERYETVLSELDLLEDLSRQANREVRTLLFELRPIILESQGLAAALRSYHQQLNDSMNCQIHLEIDEMDFQLTDKAATHLFSIAQEAVNNIRKHAHAENIWIRLQVREPNLYFEIEDDGKGFDVEAVRGDYDARGSFGLLNMQERAEMLGGHLTIESPSPRINCGTSIHGIVPIANVRAP